MPRSLSDFELPRDPDGPMEATTKQYVDGQIGGHSHTHDHNAEYVNEIDHNTSSHNALAIDHGSLSGNADDDHPHYLNVARHDVTARHPAGTVLPTAVPGSASFGDAAAEGTSGSVARADHKHGMPSHTKADHDALNIDADTLDGVDSTGFATSTHNHDGVYEPTHSHPYASDTHTHDSAYVNVTGDTVTGTLTLQNSVLSLDDTTTTEPPWYLNQNTSGSFILTQTGTGGAELQLDSDGVSHTTASLFIGGSRALTTADEGAGNGLDADTVDGSHASAFATSGHNHDAAYVNEGDHTKAAHDSLLIDADTVDGQHASAFESAGAVSTHEGATDPHMGYRLESALIGTADLANSAVTLAKLDAGAIYQGEVLEDPEFETTKWSGGYPYGWGAWGTTSAPTKEAATTRLGGASARWNVALDTDAGMWRVVSFPYADVDAVEVVIDWQLVTGGISGAGLIVDWRRADGTQNRTQVRLGDEVPSPVLGKWYTTKLIIPRPSTFGATDLDKFQFYLMASWSGFGARQAKDIVYDRVRVRPASRYWHAGNDGAGSGLDADLLDGQHASAFVETSRVSQNNVASTIAERNSAGDIHLRLLRSEYTTTTSTPNYLLAQHAVGTGDNYARPSSLAQVKSAMNAADAAHNHDADYVNEADHTKSAHDALNIDADTVDGQHANDLTAHSRSMGLLLGGM